jgi:SAM-dependent methyltransferase
MSLLLWHSAFHKAQIYGIDKRPVPKMPERVHVTTGDLYRGEFLKKFAEENGPFDMIVDDALHLPDAQRFCFKKLWNHLNPGGIFVIEDLHPNFRDKYKDKTIIPMLKDHVESIWTDNMIQSVAFYPNICFIRKA